jgi:pSer/pThr/pTyr-binding forkhead associated (FHA) protein
MVDYVEVWSDHGVRVVPLTDEGRAVVGRDPGSEVVVDADGEVSRRHALLERLPAGWCVRDLGSRNGTFVNGERVAASRALHHRDELRVGATRLVFCLADPSSTDLAPTTTAEPPPPLTRREVDVLHALFLPARTGDVFTEPASTREMAAELVVSEAAVKQHLANLYAKFGIEPGDRRRVRLANEALRRGAVDLVALRRGPTDG